MWGVSYRDWDEGLIAEVGSSGGGSEPLSHLVMGLGERCKLL